MTQFISRLTNRAKDVLYVPLLDKAWLSKRKGTVYALVYHRVENPGMWTFLDRGGSPTISQDELVSDIEYLKKHNARFLTYRDLRAGHFPSEDEIGIILTFDDCFRCNYETGLETLAEQGVKGVFFQTTGMVGSDELLPEHALFKAIDDVGLDEVVGLAAGITDVDLATPLALSELFTRKIPHEKLCMFLERIKPLIEEEKWNSRHIYPTTDHIQRAAESGHEIGSHGHLHLDRHTLGQRDFLCDMEASIDALEQVTGQRPLAMSLPYGFYKQSDVEPLEALFENIATCERLPISPNSGERKSGRFSWPGPAKNRLRWRRWLVTGGI